MRGEKRSPLPVSQIQNFAQEALWYGAYALALWFTVSVVAVVFGKQLMTERSESIIAA
jgi:hypothetical protein